MTHDTLTPVDVEITLTGVLHALSDPVRLQIVRVLATHSPQACGSFELPVTKSTRSHHMRVLREAGVISTEDVGRTRMSSLCRTQLDAALPGLLDSVLAAPTTERV